MPHVTSLLGFALISLGMVLTPGPNMIYLISRSITQGHIAGLVRELYTNLARPPEAVRVRLRAAPTFKPAASGLLGELLQDMQQRLIDGGPESDGE